MLPASDRGEKNDCTSSGAEGSAWLSEVLVLAVRSWSKTGASTSRARDTSRRSHRRVTSSSDIASIAQRNGLSIAGSLDLVGANLTGQADRGVPEAPRRFKIHGTWLHPHHVEVEAIVDTPREVALILPGSKPAG
jgi:hypothetical protein